jgi:hypothetical protein
MSPEPLSAPKAAAPITAPALDIGDRVDALLEAEWKASGVSPAGPASDAQFFRRAYLDLAGTLPPPEAVTAFLADTSPDKRARAVDALLASPRYAERWAASPRPARAAPEAAPASAAWPPRSAPPEPRTRA